MEYTNVYNEQYIQACRSKHSSFKLKVELLDWYEYTIGEITRDISQTDTGKINITNAQGSRRSCDITISNIDLKYNPTENSHFWIDRKFKLYYGLTTSTGDTYWFSKGVYITTNASLDTSTRLLSLQGADKFTILTSNANPQRFSGSVKIEQGQPFDEAISGLLCLDIGNNRPVDPIRPVIDVALRNITVPYDIVKDADTSIGDILTEFADVMDADIWYDDEGVLYVSKSVVEDSVNRYEQFASQWDFTETDSHMTSPTIESDQSNIVNTVIVTNSSSEEAINTYVAENDYPQSPIRVSLVGTKAAEIIDTTMGYNEQRRKEYANRLLQTQCLNAYTISFETIALPHLDVNRTISITQKDYDFDREILVVQDIGIDLASHTMSISATQVIWLPTYSDSGAANFDTYDIKEETYTISFNIGSEATGTTPSAKTKHAGDVFSLPRATGFSRQGYTFAGWRDDYVGTLRSAGSTFSVPAQNVTLYAEWEDVERPSIYWFMQYTVTTSNKTITLHPFTSKSYTGILDWGDGSGDVKYDSTKSYSHTYSFLNGATSQSVSVKLYVDISQDDLLPNLFSYDGTNNYQTATQMTYIKVPSTITVIPDGFLSNTSSSSTAFSSLTTVVLSDDITKLGDNSFYKCTGLTDFTVPTSVTYFGDNSLAYSKITTLDISKDVTYFGSNNLPYLTSLAIRGAFTTLVSPNLAGCTGLTSITIGGTVTAIGDNWLSGVKPSSNVAITLESSVKGIYNNGLSYSKLTSLTVPTSASTIQYIGLGALTNSSLTSLTIPYDCYFDINSIPSSCSVSFNPSYTPSWSASSIVRVGGSESFTYNGQSQILSEPRANSTYYYTSSSWGSNGRTFLKSIGQTVDQYTCYELFKDFDYTVGSYSGYEVTETKAGSYTVYFKGTGRRIKSTYVTYSVSISQVYFNQVADDTSILSDNIFISTPVVYDETEQKYRLSAEPLVYKPSGYNTYDLVQLVADFDGYTDNLVSSDLLSSDTTTKGNAVNIARQLTISNKNYYETLLSNKSKYKIVIYPPASNCSYTTRTSGEKIEYYYTEEHGYAEMFIEIVAKDITDDDVIVEFQDVYEYSENGIEPNVTLNYIYDNGSVYTLSNSDYSLTVTYNDDNTGTVQIQGYNRFTGTITKTFTLVYPTTDLDDPEVAENVYTSEIIKGETGEESVSGLVYNPTYQSYDLFPSATGTINIGSVNTLFTNINSQGLNLKYLSKTGSGNFNLTINDNGEVLKKSSAKKYKTNMSYDINKDYWHNVFMQLKTGSYNYKNTPNVFELGMFADDVAEICPQIVRYSADGSVENYEDRAIIQMLVMEVQRLNNEIQILRDSK